jgi:hypothetical protein
MTPTQTLHKTQADFRVHIDRETPVDDCVRVDQIEVARIRLQAVVDRVSATVAKRNAVIKRANYSNKMFITEKNEVRFIATCQTFLEEVAVQHNQLTVSHDARTCLTCRHGALKKTRDPADSAAALELEKMQKVQLAAYDAMVEARRIRAEEWKAEIWHHQCMHN